MKKKIFFLVFVFLVGCNGKDKTYILAVLDSQNGEPYKRARLSMLNELEQKGYKQGTNLKIIYHSIGNDKEKGKRLLKHVVKKKPDVIFTNGTVMTLAAKESKFFNNPKYSFVFTCVTDPVGVGVIEGFGIENEFNFTGVSYPVPVVSRLRFVKKIIPNLKTIGLIYAQMPQSISYKGWIEKAIQETDDLSRIKVIFKSIPLIKGENGSLEMAKLAKEHVIKLTNKVDVFISPNDQMGVQAPFANMVFKNASKPLIGLGIKDVMDKWGATAVIYPSHKSMGVQSARMIIKIFEGKNVKNIPAQWPKDNGFAFDLSKVKKFKLKIPQRFLDLAGNNIVR